MHHTRLSQDGKDVDGVKVEEKRAAEGPAVADGAAGGAA